MENILYKDIMNNTYGKFALNLNREKLVFDYGQLGVEPHMEIPVKGNEVIRLATEEIYLESSHTNVAIPAWVTSGARIHMHKLIMQAPEELYYMDTDSLKTTHTYERNDDDLGKLKLEYKMKQAAFILPKTYLEDTTSPIFKMFDLTGKERKDKRTGKKLVMKGFDRKKISNFKMEDFTSALEGDMSRLRSLNPKKFATLRTAISKNQFLMLLDEQPRQIRTRYNKRRVFKKAWEQVYDSEALHIKDGKIVNMDEDILRKWKVPTDAEFRMRQIEIEKQLEAEGVDVTQFYDTKEEYEKAHRRQ